jgi:hypothetical protein
VLPGNLAQKVEVVKATGGEESHIGVTRRNVCIIVIIVTAIAVRDGA